MENTIAHTQTTSAPRWIRLPQAGKACVHSGLKRGQMLKLASDTSNGIKVCHLREAKAKRGTRLIDLESLLAYLDRRAEGSIH
ncbi:hypothetical protein N9R65_02625 [Opitutales bacterium]|nr:hypothetical protein [Opitutales bacterium]